jgi:hypothetical protein
MGIFDIFTGAPQQQAAADTRNYISGQQTNLQNANNTARDAAGNYITQGYGNAAGALGQGYDAASGAINQGAQGALGYLGQGAAGAMGQLGQARSDLTANGGAYQPLADLAGRYKQGSDLYNNALGVNGASGSQAAQSAFTAAPGYQYTLNAGLDAIDRRANAAGMLAGGNTNRSAIDYATNAANQGYDSWLNRLQGQQAGELSATSGAAAGNQGNNQALAALGTTGANILNTQGQNQAGIVAGQGTSLADLAKGYYGGQAGLDTQQAGLLAQNTVGANNANQAAVLNLTPGYTKTYSDAAAAQTAGSGNLWNLGIQAAKLAAGAAGGIPGGGGGSAPLNISSGSIGGSGGWF